MTSSGRFFRSLNPAGSTRSRVAPLALAVFFCLPAAAQTPPKTPAVPSRSPVPNSTPPPTTIATPHPVGTPSATPSAAAPLPTPNIAGLPDLSAVDSRNRVDLAKLITLNEAIDLATKQISALTTADLNARIAAEDVKQARAAFFPRVTAPLSFIFTSPSLANTSPREPSFISADAITVYQALLSAEWRDRYFRPAAGNSAKKYRIGRSRTCRRRGCAARSYSICRGCVLQSGARDRKTARGRKQSAGGVLQFEENTRLQLEAGEVALGRSHPRALADRGTTR